MNRKTIFHWPFSPRSRAKEPDAALFSGLRVRLTLWYCGVLGIALVLFGVILYLSVQYFLLTSVEGDTHRLAVGRARLFTEAVTSSDPGAFFHACSSFGPQESFDASITDPGNQLLTACFDQNGKLLSNNSIANLHLPSAFVTNTLAKDALASQNGTASDTPDVGGKFGKTYRYAVVAFDPGSGNVEGVVVVGESIQEQENTLSLLLTLLLAVGSITLVGAGLGGLFLAHRALTPARLAWTNQQRFIADASHELRTPLTLMRADAEVLLRGRARLAEEDAVLLEDIVAEANHMSMLANSMLTLARLDSGVQHREHEVVDLDRLARQGVQRVAAFAEQKGILVRHKKTVDAFVIGDPMQLEQALLVLLDNAIKYNQPNGKVTVRTSVRNGQACLEVSDTGIGIAVEHLVHLGERFYRVDKARSREAGGTGLGLSIAQRIATLHGGSLTLVSLPNEGTTVTVLLPLASSTPSARIMDTDVAPEKSAAL